MYDNKVYQDGLTSVLLARWTLHCESPLVLRNGRSIYYNKDSNQPPKARSNKLRFQWHERTEPSSIPPEERTQFDVATLAYRWAIYDNHSRMVHQVPASAVRGVLRAWTLGHLVDPKAYSALTAPMDEEEEAKKKRIEDLRAFIENPAKGLSLMTSLFGLALDTSEDAADLSSVGRLHIETQAFASNEPLGITVNGTEARGNCGPDNVSRHLAVRNPLDRITHASYSGGLHHFLEFSRGASFDVTLRIANATPADAGLLSIWAREINDGLLRLGALSSIGRGRLSVHNPSYTLWCRQGCGLPECWSGLEPQKAPVNPPSEDPLSGLYQPYDLYKELTTCEAKITEGWNHG